MGAQKEDAAGSSSSCRKPELLAVYSSARARVCLRAALELLLQVRVALG
jgi:hypothetical protein